MVRNIRLIILLILTNDMAIKCTSQQELDEGRERTRLLQFHYG